MIGDAEIARGVAAYMKVKYRSGDYAERETLAPETRRDKQYQFATGIRKPLGRRWGLGLSYQYTANDSTFGLYEYQRNVVTLSASGSF